MRILSRNDVDRALPMNQAIDSVAWAYQATAADAVIMPNRIHISVPPLGDALHGGTSLFMPAFVGGSKPGQAGLAVKTVSVFEDNAACGLPVIQGAVLVLDAISGECVALLHGGELTAIRTGAGSGAATRSLARPDAKCVTILGAGPQSIRQLEAVCAVREIGVVYWWSRTVERLQRAIEQTRRCDWAPADIRMASNVHDATRDADVICTATSAQAPILLVDHVRPGTHINAIGSFTPEMQELAPELVAAASVFVDQRGAALQEAGDLIQARGIGLVGDDVFSREIGSVMTGDATGRMSDDEITLFKSVGIATQDVTAANVALMNAQSQSIGQCVAW